MDLDAKLLNLSGT